MAFSSRRIGSVIVAAPVGEIDHAHALRLQQDLAPVLAEAKAAKAPLVLDLAGVEYISSMGLRVLMMVAKEMGAAGAPVGVASLKPAVEEIFDIARFRYVIPVFDSVDAALAKIAPRNAGSGAAS